MSISGKKILVTGGTGFLGKNLVPKLAAEAGSVVVASIGGSDAFSNLENVRIVEGDLMDRGFSENVVKGIDVCFHLASFKKNFKYHLDHPLEVFSRNILMSGTFLEAVRHSSVRSLVIPSSVTVYESKEDFISEVDPVNFGTKDAYALSKIALEINARALSMDNQELSVSVARCDNFFGKYDDFGPDAQVIPSLIRKAVEDEEIVIWGSGNQERTFAYVGDVCDALISLVNGEKGMRLFNVSSGQAVSFKEIVRIIQGILKSEKKIIFDMDKPEGAKRRLISAEKIREEIGWEPKLSLEEGLERTVRYYLKTR
ncbi:MAG: NAD(P)-dependent oxidoreductase [Candidatus Moranbacteria bacterium]|nr:NAD(P)-dependent oxidoreductase [Candidatus Moranbacteria bacterium]